MATTRPADAAVDATPRIVRDPSILGGESTIRGTRIPVRSIVLSSRRYGDLQRVCAAYRLDGEAVRQALAFYEANRAEIDAEIEENERLAGG